MSDRCTGACCRRFVLPFTPERLAELGERARQRRLWSEAHPDVMDETLLPEELRGVNQIDIEQIAGMAIYIGQQTALGTEMQEERGGVYRCAHLRSDGDCGIYQARPWMCRDYPYGTRCPYPDCEYDAAKEGRVGGRHAPIERSVHPITGATVRVRLRMYEEPPYPLGEVVLVDRASEA